MSDPGRKSKKLTHALERAATRRAILTLDDAKLPKREPM